jgi:hypothetical protein
MPLSNAYSAGIALGFQGILQAVKNMMCSSKLVCIAYFINKIK